MVVDLRGEMITSPLYFPIFDANVSPVRLSYSHIILN
jgi:hypothetical protein